MLFSLGQFTFGLQTLPTDQLRRQTAWRHPSNSRVQWRPRCDGCNRPTDRA